MKIFKQNFYAKISIIFLGLVLFLGICMACIGVTSSFRYMEETTQKVNKNLASEMAAVIQPYLVKEIETDSIRKKIEYLEGINPEIDIFLLSESGKIKDYFLGDEDLNRELRMTKVSTEPLDRFLKGDELPILGQNPLMPDQEKPFSVAKISIMGVKDCYLYVILGGKRYDQVAGTIFDSYILKNSILGLSVFVIATIILGLVLFRWPTRRLQKMRNVVRAFEQGQLNKRVDIESEDEIGCLAKSFNQMADTLVANMEEIKKVDKLRRELVANVSHDLRSPLASIQGYLETIQIKDENQTLTPAERNKYYNIVHRNTVKLNKLVSELFELSKLDAQDVKPDLEKLSMVELVQDLVYQFQPQAEAKGIDLKARIPKEPLNLIYADIALMERAISNLIDNAIKHTPEGGSVVIIPSNEHDKVSIKVTDTGKGISEEDINRILDRFYQVDKSRSPGAGAGLGLSITQKILELHNSKLSVESKLNQGTTFSFVLG